jgi:asparagine synthase (glutamine-hydrolysing)
MNDEWNQGIKVCTVLNSACASLITHHSNSSINIIIDVEFMCGIAGIISTDRSRISIQRLKKMTDTLVHRGPEAETFWTEQYTGFGHRRLCIIDLTAGGAQPMHYLNRYTIIYNGEIYNYRELREDLEKKGYQFHSASDTEVLLAAYACYKEGCLQHLDGMFAFALWDETEKMLFAARDRFGEKPFYYFQDEKRSEFIFASEIKALFAAGVRNDYHGSMLLNFLGLGFIEHPLEKSKTFYKNIFSLAPGHYLKLQPGKRPDVKCWWKLNKMQATMCSGDAQTRFSNLLEASVNRRLRSDVPIGTSLSGGLDSSSIIAAAARFPEKSYTHKSFSAVFPGYIKDESDYIRLVSNQYKLESYFSTPDSATLAADFKRFMYFHEQPVSTASAYAQYKVYELAKQQQVTVLLDGQGADEILAGYTKYTHWYLQELWRTDFRRFRKEIYALKKNGAPINWNFRNILASWLPSLTAKKLSDKAAGTVQNTSYLDMSFVAANTDDTSFYKPEVRSLNDLLHFNVTNFGLGELLRYADSNSMAHSREVRLPFLNHELVAFVFSLPSTLKIHDGWSKWLLRKSMEKNLPSAIVWRKEKVGFEPPEKIWMRHPIVQEMVMESKMKLVGRQVLNASVLNKKNQSPDKPATDHDWRFLVAGALI